MTYNNNYYPQPYGYTLPTAAAPTLNYNIPSQQQNYFNNNNNNNNNNTGINWVQGEAGARAFRMDAGTKAILLDLEKDVFYIKAVDVSGMPLPLRTFEYNEIFSDSPQSISQAGQDTALFVTKQEFEERFSKIEELLQ